MFFRGCQIVVVWRTSQWICVKFRFTGSGFWAPNGQNEFSQKWAKSNFELVPTVGRYLRKAALKCNLFYRCFADKKAHSLEPLSSNNFDSQLGLITNRCLGNEPPKSPFSGRNIRADPRVGANLANSQLFHGNAYTDVVLTCFVDAFAGIVLFAEP